VKPPDYFEDIRAASSLRWDQLEADPELAAPWHQLFRQVQIPRHVLSELLQNADDAGATTARVYIEDGEFVFEHDGKDFTAEEFASLCKFGFSNKRNLHTIGFRGVGFKSTFSLGDEVRLVTPSLSVAFHRDRFTEPVWSEQPLTSGTTQVRVSIHDTALPRDIERSLKEWAASPLSLLFFKHVEKLQVLDQLIHRQSDGEGPVPGSEWVRLSDDQEVPYLLLRSAAEPFPDEAVQEIRQERMGGDDFELPPCVIDLVVGKDVPSRLFVVLPTGGASGLPCACNAPFMQDPARENVKEPSHSPTNRWLLERAGKYAAQAMLAWLQDDKAPLEDRAKAYTLFPHTSEQGESIEGYCKSIFSTAFRRAHLDTDFLLTETGTLVGERACLAVPLALHAIWEPEDISRLMDDRHRPLLCGGIAPEHRQALVDEEFADAVDEDAFLATLRKGRAPKPGTWRQLLLLWEFVETAFVQVRNSYYSRDRTALAIVPLNGSDELHPGSDVVRLGEKKLLASQDDWDFLSERLLALDPNWPRFLAKERRRAEVDSSQYLEAQVEVAYRVLDYVGLGETSDTSRVMERVATDFFANEACSMVDCIRLTQIFAALNASVPVDFEYVTWDGFRKATKHPVLLDIWGDLDCFVDEAWYEAHVLHDEYSDNPSSCTKQQWEAWVRSERSRLHTFVPLVRMDERIWDRATIEDAVRERGADGPISFPYKRDSFVIEDWDFAEEHWEHWEQLAEDDPRLWGKLLSHIIESPTRYRYAAAAKQVASNGNCKKITDEGLIPAWVMKLRQLPCIEDTRGIYREPAELMRRTPETEVLLDVEPFVKAEYDTERNRPLLVALGVRDTPTGPESLLERLRALAKAEEPPVHEVGKWYHRLDQLAARCSSDEMKCMVEVFGSEKLIMTDDCDWATAKQVFIRSDEEDVPGAAAIHPSVRELALWSRVGVAEYPTVDLILDWLKSISSGEKLSGADLSCARSAMKRHGSLIWHDCAHWLNLEGEWQPVESIAHKLTMQSLVSWTHLFPEVKQRTADLRMLTEDTHQQHPFREIEDLASCLEERIEMKSQGISQSEQRPWLVALGSHLKRVVMDTDEETNRVKRLATRLEDTLWRTTRGLEATPYIAGTPAGTARDVDACWTDCLLYVEDRSLACVCKDVTRELARAFAKPDLTEAIRACFERLPEFVAEYMEENFTLQPAEVEPACQRPDVAATAAMGTDAASWPDGLDDDNAAALRNEQETGETTAIDLDEQRVPRVVSTPRRNDLIDRYAVALGYRKEESGDKYEHPDGSVLGKSESELFHWDKRTSDGRFLQSYWLKEHCLQERPMKLDAAVWRLLEQYPERYALVLIDQSDRPLELSGQRLLDMRDTGLIALYPAEYRIAYEGHDA